MIDLHKIKKLNRLLPQFERLFKETLVVPPNKSGRQEYIKLMSKLSNYPTRGEESIV